METIQSDIPETFTAVARVVVAPIWLGVLRDGIIDLASIISGIAACRTFTATRYSNKLERSTDIYCAQSNIAKRRINGH